MAGEAQTGAVLGGIGAHDLGNEDVRPFSLDPLQAAQALHGGPSGHGSSKTSSFKQCVFMKGIEEASISYDPGGGYEGLAYTALLYSGGAVRDVAAEATAFGCRDWDFVASGRKIKTAPRRRSGQYSGWFTMLPKPCRPERERRCAN
ncbi:hypothetical protein DM02DRAFT_699538 [Periconia macrospinosa]|uniref:Uncharacterized protein n=1 Tax=Periconia macrospinosa TaxID=97972 RepID=A0A2V1D5H9_9PLEO|nr:hypothetical protein DM02DRAFT_699538 [Periconia macrospinosa]